MRVLSIQQAVVIVASWDSVYPYVRDSRVILFNSVALIITVIVIIFDYKFVKRNDNHNNEFCYSLLKLIVRILHVGMSRAPPFFQKITGMSIKLFCIRVQTHKICVRIFIFVYRTICLFGLSLIYSKTDAIGRAKSDDSF